MRHAAIVFVVLLCGSAALHAAIEFAPHLANAEDSQKAPASFNDGGPTGNGQGSPNSAQAQSQSKSQNEGGLGLLALTSGSTGSGAQGTGTSASTVSGSKELKEEFEQKTNPSQQKENLPTEEELDEEVVQGGGASTPEPAGVILWGALIGVGCICSRFLRR